MMVSINPANGAMLREYPEHSDAELEQKLATAAKAFQQHHRTSFSERAHRMLRAAEILESEKRSLGELMTTEMGKTLTSAIAEAEKCALACRYYAEHAEQFLADEPYPVEKAEAYVKYQPLGPVLAIMPWNFPFWQVFRFVAPALMAGNVGVLKHASNVPGCALAIEDILRRAGFDEGVFQTLLIGSSRVAQVIEDARIRAVTLTGSDSAGSAVASQAGRAIKKTVLELGGSDPFIIMPSADLDHTVEIAVKARTINNGQSCIAAKRFIVHDAIYDRFVEQFVTRMESLTVGDPMDPNTDVGPLATAQIRDGLHKQVLATIAAGGRALSGAREIDGPGFYYAPTVLADIPHDSPAYRDELFGPVASVFRADDIDHAIHLANDHKYGLGSSAWTRDPAEQQLLIDGIEAGQVFINAMVASDPRVPFGGVKSSGYGRELSRVGIHEFVNIKTVWISETGKARAHESE